MNIFGTLLIKTHFVRFEVPGFAGNVEDVDEAGGLEVSSLAGEPQLVQALVPLPVRLAHGEHRVPLAVNSLLREQLQRYPLQPNH